MMTPAATLLKELLTKDEGILLMPCCFDALSARLIEEAGCPLTFMSGFAVSATRLALPDTGLISYGEMVDQGRSITSAVSIPVIGDGDTGYGNAVNIWRTVEGYAAAGFACIMIEDQVSPKRCGHAAGKLVVERSEALVRIKAAVDAGQESGILILARTDARATHGFEEALWRAQAFADAGADIIFLEAPETEKEMHRFCQETPGVKMANMLPGGLTPLIPPEELAAMGFRIVAYPLTLLNVAIRAMRAALVDLAQGRQPKQLDFAELRRIVGFPDYEELAQRYVVEE